MLELLTDRMASAEGRCAYAEARHVDARSEAIAVRNGRIDAEKPLILKPEGWENWSFENFGPEGQAFGEWFKNHVKDLAILRYGFQLRRTDVNEEIVHEPMAAVCDRLISDLRVSGNPMRAIIQGVDDTWEISLLKFTFEMIQKSQNINLFDFKRRGLLG